jgi:hypothetical protein
MPFDRAAAKRAGYSDAEIDSYIQGQQGSPAQDRAPYSGAPDLPLQETHPIENAMMLSAVPGLVRSIPSLAAATGPALMAGARGAGRILSGPVGDVAMEALPFGMGRVAGKVAQKAIGRMVAPAVEAAATKSAPAAEAGVQAMAQRIATAAPEAAPESGVGMKEANAYWRRRTFAMMKEAGAPTDDAASRKLFSDILGREVKSRADLGIEDWVKIHGAMGDRISEQAATKAAAQAAARASKKAGVVPESVSKRIAASGQVNEGAAPVTPTTPAPGSPLKIVPPSGQLAGQLQQSARIQSWMDSQGLDPQTQAQMWAQLRAQGGQP